jgi:regulator of extracellular matrix RemA (YlzA/DUF370 family)
MFLDLGDNKGIQFEKIISIHDYDEFIKRYNYYLIKNAETQKRLIYLSKDKRIKSVIVTNDGIFLSSVLSDTLRKRLNREYDDKNTAKYIEDYMNDKFRVF